jgi:hypothetical protein
MSTTNPSKTTSNSPVFSKNYKANIILRPAKGDDFFEIERGEKIYKYGKIYFLVDPKSLEASAYTFQTGKSRAVTFAADFNRGLIFVPETLCFASRCKITQIPILEK